MGADSGVGCHEGGRDGGSGGGGFHEGVGVVGVVGPGVPRWQEVWSGGLRGEGRGGAGVDWGRGSTGVYYLFSPGCAT